MEKEKTRIEIGRLKDEIRHHDYRYFVLSNPEISDKEYDKLVSSLKELEKLYPEFVTIDSPTQRVSGEISDGFKTVTHKVKMLSLDNTYSVDELREWDERVRKSLGILKIEYVSDLKIDGVSCSLVYENGIFVRGSTRGDGEKGEDVTHNIRTIKSMPLRLFCSKGLNLPKAIDVRGEIFMQKECFQRLNNERKVLNEDLFANPRNAASGSLKLLDSSVVRKRNLQLFIHSFGWVNPENIFKSHWEFFEIAKSWGLRVNPERKLCADLEDVIEFYKLWSKKKEDLPYEVDGMVVKINLFSQQKELGMTLKSPRWAVAFKFQAAQATTSVLDVIPSVGRTGVITPVAELSPVECGGVTISHATLHNYDEIDRLRLKIKDKVLIERAGDVIPKIVKVITSVRSGKEKNVHVPRTCPACGTNITKEKEEEVAYRCLNPSCPAQAKQRILHFSSRNTMDIEGMGEAVVSQLVDHNLVKDFSDIYHLKNEDLLGLELFKEKKATNLIEAIKKSKSRPLSRLIYALGIRHVGEKASFVLAQRFNTMKRIMSATKLDFEEIHEVGEIMAQAIVEFFNQKEIRLLIEKLRRCGLNMKETGKNFRKQILAGKSIVFTGELVNYTRSQAEELVRSLGGNATSSVSNNTDFVVIGVNPGSKHDKAKKLGVKIIDEKEFTTLIKEEK